MSLNNQLTFERGKKHENNYTFANRKDAGTYFMYLKKQQLYFSTYKTALLLLYIPFFVVQCFFNIDTSSSSGVVHVQQKVANQQSNNGCNNANSSANKTNNRQVTIRLNKRFQPETVSALVNFYTETPVAFIITSSFGSYTNPFPASPHHFTRIVRGPPAVA